MDTLFNFLIEDFSRPGDAFDPHLARPYCKVCGKDAWLAWTGQYSDYCSVACRESDKNADLSKLQNRELPKPPQAPKLAEEAIKKMRAGMLSKLAAKDIKRKAVELVAKKQLAKQRTVARFDDEDTAKNNAREEYLEELKREKENYEKLQLELRAAQKEKERIRKMMERTKDDEERKRKSLERLRKKELDEAIRTRQRVAEQYEKQAADLRQAYNALKEKKLQERINLEEQAKADAQVLLLKKEAQAEEEKAALEAKLKAEAELQLTELEKKLAETNSQLTKMQQEQKLALAAQETRLLEEKERKRTEEERKKKEEEAVAFLVSTSKSLFDSQIRFDLDVRRLGQPYCSNLFCGKKVNFGDFKDLYGEEEFKIWNTCNDCQAGMFQTSLLDVQTATELQIDLPNTKFYEFSINSPVPIAFPDFSVIWPTARHLYIAQRFCCIRTQESIRQCKSFEEMDKVVSTSIDLTRNDWEIYRFKAIRMCVFLKVQQHPWLQLLLASSGHTPIYHCDWTTSVDNALSTFGDYESVGINIIGKATMEKREGLLPPGIHGSSQE